MCSFMCVCMYMYVYSYMQFIPFIKLLKLICEGEGLIFNEMKNKYLNDKEKKLSKDSNIILEVHNEDLLESIEIKGKTYFYENKEKGTIYDSDSKIVGIVKNGLQILF